MRTVSFSQHHSSSRKMCEISFALCTFCNFELSKSPASVLLSALSNWNRHIYPVHIKCRMKWKQCSAISHHKLCTSTGLAWHILTFLLSVDLDLHSLMPTKIKRTKISSTLPSRISFTIVFCADICWIFNSSNDERDTDVPLKGRWVKALHELVGPFVAKVYDATGLEQCTSTKWWQIKPVGA